MIHKILEIRDRMTYTPVLAISTDGESPEQAYHLRTAGYASDGHTIIVVRLTDCRASCDPYGWDELGARTMPNAHKYIGEHFEELKDGDVIDVEFILGETATKKNSERFICPI